MEVLQSLLIVCLTWRSRHVIWMHLSSFRSPNFGVEPKRRKQKQLAQFGLPAAVFSVNFKWISDAFEAVTYILPGSALHSKQWTLLPGRGKTYFLLQLSLHNDTLTAPRCFSCCLNINKIGKTISSPDHIWPCWTRSLSIHVPRHHIQKYEFSVIFGKCTALIRIPCNSLVRIHPKLWISINSY